MTVDAAAAGMRRVQDALRAIADGDDKRALAALTAGSLEETAWAAATLLGQVRELVGLLADGDRCKARKLLLAGADGIDDDIFEAGAHLIIEEGRGDLP